MSKILIAEIDCYNVEQILSKMQTDIKTGWNKGATNTGERWILSDEHTFNELQELTSDRSSIKELEKEIENLEDKIGDLESDLEDEEEAASKISIELKKLQEKYDLAITTIEETRVAYQELKKENTILKNEAKIGKLKSTN